MNQPNSDKTYALVVGIEKYDAGSRWDLNGPALDALKFAEWLSNKDVPDENILLFISALDENEAEVNNFKIKSKKASRPNIYEAVTRTIPKNKEKGELLYIYWSGHGTSKKRKDWRLYYDDSHENLNLESLLDSLNTSFFGGFNQQILIIDACGTYYSRKSPESLPKEEYPQGFKEIRTRERSILFATKEGYITKNIDAEKTGRFSKILFKELEKEDKLITPKEIAEVQKNIQIKFKECYPNEPTPTCLYFVDADGNGKTLPLNQSANEYFTLNEKWNDLVKIISQIDWQIISSCCFYVLSEYSTNPQGSYAELFQQELLEKNNDIELLKNIQEDNYANLRRILLEQKHKNNNGNQSDLPLVIKFAQNLAKSEETEVLAIQENLNRWIKNLAQELHIDIHKLDQFKIVPKKKLSSRLNPYLLVIVEPKLLKYNSRFEFNLSAELFFYEDSNYAKTSSQVKNINLTNNQYIQANREDICNKLYQLIEQCNRLLVKLNNTIKLTVELFLPKQYLVKFCPEIQKIPISEGEPPWFGVEYKIILRSYDRFNNYGYRQNLLNKWNKFSDLMENMRDLPEMTIKDNMICLSQISQEYNWKKLRAQMQVNNKIGVNINLPLLSEKYSCYINNFVESLLRCGIPFSFWLREKELEKLKLSENQKIETFEFEDILKVDKFARLETLFEYIREIRNNAYIQEDKNQQKNYLGYHLGFLCDHPYRLPSKFNEEEGGDDLIFGL